MGSSYSSFSGDHGSSGPAERPRAEQLAAWNRRLGAPDNEVPVLLPTAVVLGRSEDVVVALIGGSAYTTGLSLNLAVRLRQNRRSRGRPEGTILGFDGDESAAERFLLGVEFADGRSTSNLASRWLSPDGDLSPEEPYLASGGGGGSDRTWDQTFWLSPLPPSGPLRIVCTWELFGIAETHTLLDGGAIAEAGRRAEAVWPWEPPVDPENSGIEEPELPADGWFARTFSARRGRRPD